MTGSRCPACGAATPETVPWCSLCFADLRPVPAADVPAPRHAAPESAQPAAPGVPDGAATDPLTAPISTLLDTHEAVTVAAVEAPVPVEAAEVAAALPGVVVDPLVAAATWPCSRCGARVPLLLDACDECGAGFLTGAIPPMTMSLPLVGDVAALSKAKRFSLAAGLAVGLVVLFIALTTIGGAVL
jgi:hypothetical protein